jgi:hypothetical protein
MPKISATKLNSSIIQIKYTLQQNIRIKGQKIKIADNAKWNSQLPVFYPSPKNWLIQNLLNDKTTAPNHSN